MSTDTVASGPAKDAPEADGGPVAEGIDDAPNGGDPEESPGGEAAEAPGDGPETDLAEDPEKSLPEDEAEAPEANLANGAEESPEAVRQEDPGEHSLLADLFDNPASWPLWPAVALLRWMLRNRNRENRFRRLVYRSLPSIAFRSNEIQGVAMGGDAIDLTLTAPGIAAPGSPLPLSDIARIAAESRPPGRGAISAWLDGPTDLFMQVSETARSRHSTAFSLATGGEIHAVRQAARLAGITAPLDAEPEHRLKGQPTLDPAGAIGLAAFFVAAPSARGLEALLTAFTGIPAEVIEFTGKRVRSLRPATMNAPLMRTMGLFCTVPAGGVDVVLDGGGDESARRWAEDPERCASLRLLCERYLGASGVGCDLYLDISATNAKAATLGESMLGGMAVLGTSQADSVRVPLNA